MRRLPVLCALLLAACGGKSYWLGQYEKEIQKGTEALAAAKTDGERAAALTLRGRGYGEKARYSRAFKLVGPAAYRGLFALAQADHDKAVALAPGDAEAWFGRGRTFYDRAAPSIPDDYDTPAEREAWGERAKESFAKAIAADPRHALAWDFRGLLRMSEKDFDGAIADFAAEARIDPKASSRLADAYCERGLAHSKAGRLDAAVADEERARDIGVSADACECDPYSPLVGLYTAQKRYDDAWRIAREAKSKRRWVMPEALERLKKESGRSE